MRSTSSKPQAQAKEIVNTGSEKSERRADSAHDTQNCCDQRYKFDQAVSDDGQEWAAAFPRCLQDDGSAADLAEGQDRVPAASSALEVQLIHQKRISERTQIVDVPVPLDSSSGVQPGDQARRVPADSVHRQCCCRDACGDAEKGPSVSDCIEDSGNPACEVRRQSCGGACVHADAPVPPVALEERISARKHEQTVDQAGDQACRDPAWKTADAVCRQSCGCAGTVTGDDSDCGSDRSSIFDRLMAKLLGNAEQEDPQVEEESSSWMGDLARSWRQGKSARKWARHRGWRREFHDSWSWAGDGWSRREQLSVGQTDNFF